MNKSLVLSPANPITLIDPHDFLPLWIEYLKLRERAKEISPDTINGYVFGATKFLDWLSDNPTPESIRTWKALLLEQSYRPSTINAWLAGVRSFFKWLAERGHIPFDPAAQIEGVKRRNSQMHLRQPFTNGEIMSILDAPDLTALDGRRNYAILLLLAYCGLRQVSVFWSNVDDLDKVGKKMVLHYRGKGHLEKDLTVYLQAHVEKAVQDYLADRAKIKVVPDKLGDPLFVSYSNQSKGERIARRTIRWINLRYRKSAGAMRKNTSGHSFRHSATTNAIEMTGGDLLKVQGMTGHGSLDTLSIYAHLMEREKDPAELHIDYSEIK